MDYKVGEYAHMKSIIKLEAVDHIDEPSGNTTIERMLIGFFDSDSVCNEVEKDYRLLPGFSLLGCRFVRTTYELPLSDSSNCDCVFYAQACILGAKTGEEAIIEIGLFLSEEEADSARSAFLAGHSNTHHPRFDSASISVHIDEYEINKRHWQEGFTRYTYIASDNM